MSVYLDQKVIRFTECASKHVLIRVRILRNFPYYFLKGRAGGSGVTGTKSAGGGII
jgi:hypothetical protein